MLHTHASVAVGVDIRIRLRDSVRVISVRNMGNHGNNYVHIYVYTYIYSLRRCQCDCHLSPSIADPSHTRQVLESVNDPSTVCIVCMYIMPRRPPIVTDNICLIYIFEVLPTIQPPRSKTKSRSCWYHRRCNCEVPESFRRGHRKNPTILCLNIYMMDEVKVLYTNSSSRCTPTILLTYL